MSAWVWTLVFMAAGYASLYAATGYVAPHLTRMQRVDLVLWLNSAAVTFYWAWQIGGPA